MEELEDEISKVLFDHMNDELYCFTCHGIKKIRTRHCRHCKRCVRRFDHHCPWTGNCVGQLNIKFFIQFLFYATFTLLLFCLIQVRRGDP